VAAAPALDALPAAEIARKVKAREVSAAEVTAAIFHRIAATEPEIHAYLHVTPERAQARAKEIDARIARGEDPGRLAGVPVALKDNISTRGIPTTAASKILAGYVPPYDATVVERLEREGAIIVGKTNLDEFAMGSSTESSGYFTTRNPWARDRVPGGSSGGSAAAVAARSAACALGSDTGGSVRQPAALCGVVGLKPTYGLVSRYGLLAFASSLDQIGPLARTVADCALVAEAIAGHDERDSTSVPKPAPPLTARLEDWPAGLRIGVPKEYAAAAQEPGVRARTDEAIRALAAIGAELVEVSLPHTDYGIATYYVIATAEASSNLARYDGVHYGRRAAGAKDIVELYARSRGEGFGPEVKRRIFLGTFVLSSGYHEAYYGRAQKARALIRRDFEQAFERCDVIASPTSPVTAFRLGERTADPLLMYAADAFTVAVNLAGLPGISVPCGLADGLPVGLQLVGRAFADELLLRVARGYERHAGGFPAPPDPLPPRPAVARAPDRPHP
jgi:aspartyl-tRNA(Asn)/glutamyl-tRNA(Gln) amidotransferase subunit A